MKELGRAGAKYLTGIIQRDDIIAVTGGSSVASIAEMISPTPLYKTVTFVPARGGIGGNVGLQANTLASQMAMRVGAAYKLLHLPDILSSNAYHSIIEDSQIADVLGQIRSAALSFMALGKLSLWPKGAV